MSTGEIIGVNRADLCLSLSVPLTHAISRLLSSLLSSNQLLLRRSSIADRPSSDISGLIAHKRAELVPFA